MDDRQRYGEYHMINRMYAQYADKPKAVAWYGIIPSIASELEQAYNDIKISYSIDDNTREQLNVIGRVVVVGDTWETVANLIVGGRELVEETPQLNQLGSNQLGSFQLTPNQVGYAYVDNIYRQLIRSKIAKNNSDATIDSILGAISFITGDSNITVSDFEDMTFDVVFLDNISNEQIEILTNFDLVPKPQGVRFRGYAVLPSSTVWGADESQWGADESQWGFYFGS